MNGYKNQTWSDDDYTLQGLEGKSEKEIRKEYTKVRDILQKRYKRLLKNPVGSITAKAIEYALTGIPKLKDLASPLDVKVELSKQFYELAFGDWSLSSIKAKKQMDDYFEEYINPNIDIMEDFDDVSETVGSRPEGQGTAQGDFWKWLKSKYDTAYLPPSDLINEQVWNELDSGHTKRGMQSMFGKWLKQQSAMAGTRIGSVGSKGFTPRTHVLGERDILR